MSLYIISGREKKTFYVEYFTEFLEKPQEKPIYECTTYSDWRVFDGLSFEMRLFVAHPKE